MPQAKTTTRPKPKPTLPPQPKPRKIDYQVKVENGSFSERFSFCRIYVTDGVKKIREFNVERINEGFGSTPQAAIDDFVRRNNSDVLNMIFDL